MKLYKTKAIFLKQCKDTLKNMQVMMLYIIYPIIAIVLTSVMPEAKGQITFFIKVFATMHMVFTPIVTTTSILAEEKEQNTLRVLIMSNVNAVEYLLGIGSFIFLSTSIGTVFFAYLSGFQGEELLIFLVSMMLGTVCSILIGFLAGLLARNQIAATGVTIPVAMILAFLPMLSSFNTSIEKIGAVTYSQQISYLLENPELSGLTIQRLLPIGINVIIIAIFLYMIFRKKGIQV